MSKHVENMNEMAVLNQRVSTALSSNPYLPAHELTFAADEGRITLTGRVESFYQKQMAQEAVRHVEGVEQIDNLLEVDWA